MKSPPELLYRQFRTVFDTYYNSLCNYAFTFVKNPDTSEDIVQEVFTRVWESRPDLIPTDAIRYYLFTAVRNNCITHLRQEKNIGRVEWDDLEPGYEPVATKDPGPGGEMNYEDLLVRGIDRLPPKCREVFLLSRFSNMSYREIANSLNISIKTVENQVGKALKTLRHFLQEQGVWLVFFLGAFFS